jgi:hypothetical protein
MSTPVEQWLPGMDITAGRLEAMNDRTWLSVTNFGADNSGTVNADAAIQRALNDARDRGGAQVLVPPGVYLIGAVLRIYQNTRLTLMTGAEFRRNYGGTMLLNGDAGQDFGGYTGNGSIVIEGGLWNMQGTTPGLTGNAMCISIGHATDILIQDLEIRDLPGFHGVELNSTSHGTIRNCKFRGYIDPGGRDFSEAIQIDLAKSVGVFGGFGPYDHTPCQDILVTGCHFGNSDTAGTTAWPRGIGSHSATIGRWHRRIRISDNSFENLTQFAVSAYNYEDLTVTGNTMVQCGSGVRLRAVILSDPEDTKDVNGNQTNASQNMRNLTVTGNSFRGMGTYGDVIEARGETSGTVFNLSITGNVVDTSGTGANGISLNYVERATITGNTFANIGNTAVSMGNASARVVVAANQITWGGGYGITAVGTTNTTISDNQIHFPGTGGILVDGNASDIQILGNFVKGPSRSTVSTNYHGINLTGTASSVEVIGNKCRPYGSGNEAQYAFRAATGVRLLRRYGNDWRGAEWRGGPTSVDAAVTESNSSADVLT